MAFAMRTMCTHYSSNEQPLMWIDLKQDARFCDAVSVITTSICTIYAAGCTRMASTLGICSQERQEPDSILADITVKVRKALYPADGCLRSTGRGPLLTGACDSHRCPVWEQSARHPVSSSSQLRTGYQKILYKHLSLSVLQGQCFQKHTLWIR